VSPTIQHIVTLLFDIERPAFDLTQEWVTKRCTQFHQTTLKSILNQSFQDFRIWLICSTKDQQRTDGLIWNNRCELHHDFAANALSKIVTDYVALTRIDSDDLMHMNAMQDVHDHLVFDKSAFRRCLIFRKNLQYSMKNRMLGPHYRQGFQNAKAMQELHYVAHGSRAGSKSSDTIELSKHKICVIKHEDCCTIKRNPSNMITDEEKEKRLKKGEVICIEREGIRAILKDFAAEELCT